jgi:hypothetical protein
MGPPAGPYSYIRGLTAVGRLRPHLCASLQSRLPLTAKGTGMPMVADRRFELTPPAHVQPGAHVWAIRYTGEVFPVYEQYIERLMLYRRRIWTCEFTNQANLTFEEALMSELSATSYIEKFPQTHFKVLLEKIQFSTSRIEELVQTVHTYYSDHYMPGEELEALDGDSVTRVRIRHEQRSLGLGEEEEGLDSSQYEVEWLDHPERTDTLVDEEAIMRPTKGSIPSKVLIRNTIKAVSLKEGYPNSPWIVRKEIAEEYSVETELPAELKRAREEYHRRRVEPAEKRQKREGESATERKEREREERRLKREEEKRRKALEARYPMADELVEHPTPLQLPTSLSPHITMGPLHIERAVYIWWALNTFGHSWRITPFTFEEFDLALHHQGPCTLRNEAIVALLRVSLQKLQKDVRKQMGISDRDVDSGKPDDMESTWMEPGTEWLLGLDLSSISASTQTWETLLRQYLQYMAELSMLKRLELHANHAYVRSVDADAASFGGQPEFTWRPNGEELELVYMDEDNGVVKSEGGTTTTGAHEQSAGLAQPFPSTAEKSQAAGSAAPSTGAPQTAPHASVSADVGTGTNPGDDTVASAGAIVASESSSTAEEPSRRVATAFDGHRLRGVLIRVVRGILKARDGGRLRAELFLEIPDREVYPDYYEVVSQPISVNMIIEQAERGAFTEPAAFSAAWQRLRDNAHLYNPIGSQVCQDADWFLSVVVRQMNQYTEVQKLQESADDTLSGLDVPDLTGVIVGAFVDGTALADDTLNLLSFLVDEALSAETSREHISSVLDEVRSEMPRYHRTSLLYHADVMLMC